MGGHPMFLLKGDIQLGVNETLRDMSPVISSMVSGIIARVGIHGDVEELAKHTSVPVINGWSNMPPIADGGDFLDHERDIWEGRKGSGCSKWRGSGMQIMSSLIWP